MSKTPDPSLGVHRVVSTRLPFELGKSKLTIAKPDGEHQRFECFPMQIDENGSLVCCIQNDRSGWWEDWNLQHTLAGIRSGFYRVESSC